MKRKASGQVVRVVKRRRTSKSLSKTQAKAVTTIAKRVALGTAETKFFRYQGACEPLSNNQISFNLFYHGVSQGTNAYQFNGEKFAWRGIKIKYQIQNYTTDVVNTWWEQPFHVNFLIIGVPDIYKTSTNVSTTEISDGTSTVIDLMYMKPNVKVLYKRTVHFGQDNKKQITGATSAITYKLKTGNIWLKQNKVLEFQDFGTDYKLRNMQYYLLVQVASASGGPKCHVDFTWHNYFKDS